MIGLDHEHLADVGDADPFARQRLLGVRHAVVVDERVHEAAAVAGERGQAAQMHAGGHRHLAEPRELARLVPHAQP